MPNERKDYYETGCDGSEMDAVTINVPSDAAQSERYALSRQCDNAMHSECAYPEKCKCECHGISASPAEGVRELVAQLIVGDESVDEWERKYMVDRIVAFVEARERVAVEAEREANCKEMCRHCRKAYPTVSDHGFWRHDLGAGQFAFCDASPIRARKPSETRVTCPDGITHRERRVGERRVENSPPFNACLRDGRPTSGERDFSKNRRQSEERADRCQHCGGALCGR